ncbi:hypothetical protein [Pseudomonas serbica]|uniref:hypothetical protein n=1 Tax=Pseudomonas serbica TaxID=2965074 RepID=UPI00237B656F|nr:hypothetical protein [Pseudomonas serbica]
MATWLELRCENQHQDSAYKLSGTAQGSCWSWENKNPSSLSDDNQSDVLVTLRRLADDAKEAGWLKTRTGWHCPFCTIQLGLRPAP